MTNERLLRLEPRTQPGPTYRSLLGDKKTRVKDLSLSILTVAKHVFSNPI